MTVKHRMCLRGDTPVFEPLINYIVEQFAEFTWARSHKEACESIIESTKDLDLWDEFYVDGPEGLLAFAVVADDDDAQVGPCLGVQWCMALPGSPPWAIPRIHRALRKYAKKCGYEVMAYTHRLSEGRYEINYVKV